MPGKQTGRYIGGREDKGDMADEQQTFEVEMKSGWDALPKPSLTQMGFELRKNPTSVQDFRDDEEVRQKYYPEMEALIKRATGASHVFLFDHTVRKSSVTNLNALGGAAAGSVVRVHCDYTAESAPRRFLQLCETESYTGQKFDRAEVEKLMEGRFAFVNCWRPIRDEPVKVKPLALCDTYSVDPETFLKYELRFPERTGENYSLEPSKEHSWYYFPDMEKEDCILFYVYDKKEEGPRFVFHTAFDDPTTPEDAPDRESIEVRAIVCYQEPEKRGFFFDMVHSNNAARIRLWLRLKGLSHLIDSKMITYDELQSEGYRKVNPLKKVPAFITEDEKCVFESFVIMQYLEDKYGHLGAPLMPNAPEERVHVNLLVRMHDIYIASPNCTQPGFAHTQGAMYLSPHVTPWSSAERVMDPKTRAAKIAEIWKQLTWLEDQVQGPYLAGDEITHADITWYPTTIFMEFMLPRAFGWPEIFHETEHFPKLTKWHQLLSAQPEFKKVHAEIWNFWEQKEKDGQFDSVREEVAKQTDYKWKYP